MRGAGNLESADADSAVYTTVELNSGHGERAASTVA
jgi:hypothetical protein